MFIKGNPNHWSKLSSREQTLQKISQKLKGRTPPNKQENYRRCIFCNKLCRLPNARLAAFKYCSRECQHIDLKNKDPWNKGLKGTNLGVNNGMWKGADINYGSLHDWVSYHKGQPEMCEGCGVDGLTGRKIGWANISYEYKRDLEDWIRLCAKCHNKFDNISAKVWAVRRANGT